MATEHQPTRRQFLATSGAAAAALSGMPLMVHGQGSGEIRIALVGCGGRGSGAVLNAFETKPTPIKLVAMADVFPDRLKSSYDALIKRAPKQMDVPADRQFVGFDAYKHAMDALRPGDIVILTTPPAFRWVHFQYAIQKRLNVFMEKPVTVDGPTNKRMLALGEQASAAGLKVGVGLMSRHAKPMQELHERIRNGELGEILFMRGYRMHGPAATFESTPKPAEMSDLEYQIRRFHSFLWTSGGCFNDFYIHIIDQLNWMKGALPISAHGAGGRHYRQSAEGLPFVDQNFDTYAVEYTYADGTKMFFEGRCMHNTKGIFSSYVHGTKGVAIASRANDCGRPSAIYRGHNMTEDRLVWQSTDETNPYQNEWDVLLDRIVKDKPHNEVRTGVEASLVSSMGRMAAHIGQEVTYEQMLNCEHEFAPEVDKLTSSSPSPLMPDASGRYPRPEPGQKQLREY